jgi:hypothetical protein
MAKKSSLRRAIERERRYPQTKGIAPQSTPDWITPPGYRDSKANLYTCRRDGDFYCVMFRGRVITHVHIEEFYRNAAREQCRDGVKFTEGKRGDILFRKGKGKVVDVQPPEVLMLRQVTRLPKHFGVRDSQDYPHNRKDIELALRRQANYDLWLWQEQRRFSKRDEWLCQYQRLVEFEALARCLLAEGAVAA